MAGFLTTDQLEKYNKRHGSVRVFSFAGDGQEGIAVAVGRALNFSINIPDGGAGPVPEIKAITIDASTEGAPVFLNGGDGAAVIQSETRIISPPAAKPSSSDPTNHPPQRNNLPFHNSVLWREFLTLSTWEYVHNFFLKYSLISRRNTGESGVCATISRFLFLLFFFCRLAKRLVLGWPRLPSLPPA